LKLEHYWNKPAVGSVRSAAESAAKSQRTVQLPRTLADELRLWDGSDHALEAFIFPNERKRNGAKGNGFIRMDKQAHV